MGIFKYTGIAEKLDRKVKTKLSAERDKMIEWDWEVVTGC